MKTRVINIKDLESRNIADLSIDEIATFGSDLIHFPETYKKGMRLLLRASDASHYVTTHNIIFALENLPYGKLWNNRDVDYYKRRRTQIWEAPWKRLLNDTKSVLGCYGYKKRRSIFWKRQDHLKIIELRKLRWNCDYTIRLGKSGIDEPVPKHIESCLENTMLGHLFESVEMGEYLCEFDCPEIRNEDILQLLNNLVSKGLPWLDAPL
jgi:hypothetical protein